MARFLVLTLALFAALPGVCVAATVEMDVMVEREGGEEYRYGAVAIVAAPGETNTMTIDYTGPADGQPPVLFVTDTTAPLTPGERCEREDADTIRCRDVTLGSIADAEADLGDMDDTASYDDGDDVYVVIKGGAGDDELSGTSVDLAGDAGNDRLIGAGGTESLSGGDGNDILNGHDGGDYLTGGPGNDSLTGGDGNDSLYGGATINDTAGAGMDTLDAGAGNDTLGDQDELGKSVEIGPDTLNGGPGSDFVASYILRSEPVVVDLRVEDAVNGRAGENDTLVDVENVDGGRKADTLIGNDEPNRIDGYRGRDLIRGGGGEDELRSDVSSSVTRSNRAAKRFGPDRVFGDGGNDLIYTLPTMESRASCGDGDADRVVLRGFSSDRAPSSAGPLVSHTCESLTMDSAPPKRAVTLDPSPVEADADSLVFAFTRFRCCEQVLQVNRGPRVVGTRKIKRKRVRVEVGEDALAGSDARAVTLRGKVARVAKNRFVWRFQVGDGAF